MALRLEGMRLTGTIPLCLLVRNPEDQKGCSFPQAHSTPGWEGGWRWTRFFMSKGWGTVHRRAAASPSNPSLEGPTAEGLGAAWTQGEPTVCVDWEAALPQRSTC